MPFVQSISVEATGRRMLEKDGLTSLAAVDEGYPAEAASLRWVTSGINLQGASPPHGSSVHIS